MDREIKNKIKNTVGSGIKNTVVGAKAAVDCAVKVGKGTKKLIGAVKEDVAAVRERDPAARSELEVLLLYAGVHALAAHRVAHELYKMPGGAVQRWRSCHSARAHSQEPRVPGGVPRGTGGPVA